MRIEVEFYPSWINAERFENAIASAESPHASTVFEVVFVFPVDCKIMVDAGTRLLSLANQLAQSTKRVTLRFDEAMDGTMGYLNRLGFFDYLHSHVNVLPSRPAISGASIHRGHNQALVEIARINPLETEQALPGRLADVLSGAMQNNEARAKKLNFAAFTVFSELIQNIYRHSDTQLDGYAALQVYRNGGKATVSVSDSGRGILETLRPNLKSDHRLRGLSDAELLIEMVTNGVSRFGKDNGCGIRQSAQHALAFNATIDFRFLASRILLASRNGGFSLQYAASSIALPLIWGTHIAFDFQLDS